VNYFGDRARGQSAVDSGWSHPLHDFVPDQVASHIYGHSTVGNGHDDSAFVLSGDVTKSYFETLSSGIRALATSRFKVAIMAGDSPFRLELVTRLAPVVPVHAFSESLVGDTRRPESFCYRPRRLEGSPHGTGPYRSHLELCEMSSDR
jgi:hypothetical protein